MISLRTFFLGLLYETHMALHRLLSSIFDGAGKKWHEQSQDRELQRQEQTILEQLTFP